MSEQWFREEIAGAVGVLPPSGPDLELVVARGRVARRRHRRLVAAGSGVGLTTAAGVTGLVLSLAGSAPAGQTAVVPGGPGGTSTTGGGLVTASSAPTRGDGSALPTASGPSTPVAASGAKPSPLPPPTRVPGGPTCTPGTATDPGSAASRVATMCLPAQLPRWSLRRAADHVDGTAAVYFLADGTGGEVTMQMAPGSDAVLAGTADFEPRADGTVGNPTNNSYRFVEHVTVQGVQGTAVRTRDGRIGVLVHVDGISIEAYAAGGAPATADQLVALVDALRWDRASLVGLLRDHQARALKDRKSAP